MKKWIFVALCSACLTSVVSCDDDEGGSSDGSDSNAGSAGTDSGADCDEAACTECVNQLDIMNPDVTMCAMACEGCMGAGDDSDSDSDTTTPTTTTDGGGDNGDFGKPCEDKVSTGQSSDCEPPTNCFGFGGPDYCTIECSSSDMCPETFECGSVGATNVNYCKPQ
jgi:hypothetical protein